MKKKKDKRFKKQLLILIALTCAIFFGLQTFDIYEDTKFEHKYVAGDCIGFDLYDQDFMRNSSGEIIGEVRIEYVRYTKNGAYYGLRMLNDSSREVEFKYNKSKDYEKAIGIMHAKTLDNFPYAHSFSFTDYIPGSNIVTIRNGITCRHGWKD